MHPLRFPNSSIKAKVFVRKIGFKLRVMRLYHIESFYVFLLHFHSEGSEEEGRPATASPHVWLATARASPKGRPAAPARGGACGKKSRSLIAQRPQRGPAVGRSQGAAARGQPCRNQGRLRQPQGCLTLGRAAASGQGQPPPTQEQQRRRRRGRKRG
ncbi:hypothetical protein BHM03_00024978 [Ensete ventricosum]|uniref:Uncharacterized protein n=1 Tax=Ensete ventricosum TaxID=4639 RepID=A0A445MGW3_ENSVE|nr:hypothetical protein BHM03_00024978 [Ensete ventricosum]